MAVMVCLLCLKACHRCKLRLFRLAARLKLTEAVLPVHVANGYALAVMKMFCARKMDAYFLVVYPMLQV
jgi:hypothetical protein